MVDADRPDAAAKDAQSASILTAVYDQANATLAALRQTAAALDAVERAAAAVEQAKGRNDDTVWYWTLSSLPLLQCGEQHSKLASPHGILLAAAAAPREASFTVQTMYVAV